MKIGYLIRTVLMVFSAFCGGLAEAKTQPPNIIFFITDDQSKSQFNFNVEGEGKNLCPTIDRLASEGTILRELHISSPVCTPSRYSCLTGQYASRSSCEWLTGRIKQEGMAVVDWNSYIMPDTETLPKILQQHGYATGAVGKNHVVFLENLDALKPKSSDDPSSKETNRRLKNVNDLLKAEFNKAGFNFADGLYPNNPYYLGPLDLAVHNPEYIAEAADRFIEQNKTNSFFLYYATTLPHGPENKERSWGADPHYTAMGIQDTPPQSALPPRDTLEKRIADAGLKSDGKDPEAILWIDDALKALVDKLEKEQLLEHTIIVFLSDHDMMAKGTIYQGGAHTSGFIWKKGGFPVGSELASLTSNVDFAPTLLEMAGIDQRPEVCDGISFAPQLEGKTAGARDHVYFEIGYSRGIRIGNWKYMALRYSEKADKLPIAERQKKLDDFNTLMKSQGKDSYLKLNDDPMTPYSHMLLIPGGGGADRPAITAYPDYFDTDQLYNLETDPNEQTNLAKNPEYTDVLQRMKEHLVKQLKTVPGEFAEFTGNK